MEWRKIKSIPGLEISDSGEIRGNIDYRNRKSKTEGPAIFANGKTWRIKRLMAEAFLGINISVGMHKIIQIDGDVRNVNLSNLKIVMFSEICREAASDRRGSLNCISKERVDKIRQDRSEGFTMVEVANLNDISSTLVRKVLNYETKYDEGNNI